MLRTLVDDWAHLNVEDRRRLIGEVFAEVRVDAQGVRDFMPRDEWKPYMAAVVPATATVTTERKTGFEPAVRPSLRPHLARPRRRSRRDAVGLLK